MQRTRTRAIAASRASQTTGNRLLSAEVPRSGTRPATDRGAPPDIGASTNNDLGSGRDGAARLVVLELLSRSAGSSRRQLYRALPDVPGPTLEAAVEMLLCQHVIRCEGDVLRPSAALSAIDRLELISI